ncbi:proline-rich transmembrane protein 4-like [Frankliniella occidentalis]|uniref:Proline-rich transmembrane protein 4-like n=1 Tax=Frankliniella occidentalis TaxID=133901 RepID=A0A9C6TZC7_FRAOC|nr:proline-rich transmembrane protein 4-like [Frankliniella occidentalis]
MAPAPEAGGVANASDLFDWLNATQAAADGKGGGWECSRPRLGHPVALAVAPALETLLANMKLAFMLHVYGIACLFGVLATYTFFSLINLRTLISSRPFMTSINVFLCLLGASRAAYLMLDPYNLRQLMPRILGALLWDLAFPCLTSAFCLIQLAFFQLTQVGTT